MRDEDESKHFEINAPRGKKAMMPHPHRGGLGTHHPDDSHLVKHFNSVHTSMSDGIPHPHRAKKMPRF
jgi:hypothetical protein